MLKILTDKVRDFVAINLSKYFNLKGKSYILNWEQNLRKVAKSLHNLSNNTWWSRKICRDHAVKFF